MSLNETVQVTLTRSALEEGERHYQVTVALGAGRPDSRELLEMMLDASSALLVDIQRQTQAPLEDLLDDVWNRLANLVETTERQGGGALH